MATNIDALTEKEKQTLRLIVRGHDAKSIARELDLSIHTINERLREARRKMAVSSSREAARALFEEEGGLGDFSPDFLGPKQIGDADGAAAVELMSMPENGGGRKRRVWIIAGVVVMSLILALAAATSLPQAMLAPVADTMPSSTAQTAEIEGTARRFLELVDQGKWDESYALTAPSFQKLNTAKVWADVSNKVRPPLGAVVSRTFLSHEDVPTPPAGYEIVKFRTSFANKPDAVEKVSLERVGGSWRVAGVYIE